jgi:ACT domain-containing protein
MSASYNIVCEQGTTFNFIFTIKNDETPWDLTNYTATMTVRPFIGANSTVIVATTSNYITLGTTNGKVTVNIPANITINFNASSHDYDLILDSGTEVTRILEGKFIVTPGVSV